MLDDLSFLRTRGAVQRIVAVACVFVGVGLAYALLAPKWYQTTLTVVPTKSPRQGASALLGNADLSGLSAGLDLSLGGNADVHRISAVLQSVAVTDSVIERFQLQTRYNERYQETTRDALWKHCAVRTLPKPGLVELSCEDKDPKFLQQMLTYFAEYGNQVFRRVGVSSASEQVRFLQSRVVELRQEAEATAARMREFQEKHNIIDLDTQTKEVVSAIAALQTQRTGKELELEFGKTFSSREEASLRQLQSQIAIMDRQLDTMEAAPPMAGETGIRSKHSRAGIFPAALAVPKLRAEFETLYRDRRVSEATLVFALERLEAARIDEARDVSTFLVLDPPALPTRPSWPRRGSILLLSALAGMLAGLAFEWWRSGAGPALIQTKFGVSVRVGTGAKAA